MSDWVTRTFQPSTRDVRLRANQIDIRPSPSLPPQEIIKQLVSLGERWADGQSQDDDITFVVIKKVDLKP
ncbi:MAG: hypothetical protein M3X11_16155 [Acidobacteriota bacterium]|nr:hypothetical protein [Acidobacteriota bacterium]